MNSALIVRAAAETDLLQAAQWYEVRSDGLGTVFLQEVDRLLESIRRNPCQFKIRYKKNKLRWGLLNRFPYKVVYLLQEDKVHVIGVTHAARHHAAWKRRIR